MRITNNMMINNTSMNINNNKINFMFTNTQMSSQKKISRPSDDPVIAIRSLRLRSSLSQINQYCKKNIPDAWTWLETTETALTNMNKILTDVKTQCNTGTNSYLTPEDRDTILKSLTALQKQLYSEGNSDNTGRNIFTGYKTNSQLAFMEDEKETSYEITQKFTYKDINEYTYYSGNIDMPKTVTEVQNTANIGDIAKDSHGRIRLAYDKIEDMESFSYKTDAGTVTFTKNNAGGYDAVDENGNPVANAPNVTVYDSEEDWEDALNRKTIGDNDIIIVKNTGDVVLGKELSNGLKTNKASFEINYKKTGFEKGELRPEYYYNCTDVTASNPKPIVYTKYREDGSKVYEDINYTIAVNQTLKVNMHADELFDMNIYQDVTELIDAVQNAIDAHEKVDKLKEMKNEAQYVDCQEEIQQWIDAAQKEADYADHRLTELYSAGIGKFDKYMDTLNRAITEVGARGEQLTMTETRIGNQQLTVEDLKSTNEDEEISNIIINYTAAYNAYQASLMAASKIEKQTLLDYI